MKHLFSVVRLKWATQDYDPGKKKRDLAKSYSYLAFCQEEISGPQCREGKLKQSLVFLLS